MEAGRSVEIISHLHGFGSGYALNNSYVLTALHVVERQTGLRVRLLESYRAGNQIWTPADVAWFDRALDIALLKTSGPIPLDLPLRMPSFATIRDDEAYPFEGHGFPKFQEAENSREIYAVTGELRRAGKGPGFYLLLPRGSPRDPAMWAGFSGTALFSGSHLVGVVTSVSTAVDGLIQACDVAQIVANIHFQQALQLQTQLAVFSLGQGRTPVFKPKYVNAFRVDTKQDMAELSRFFSLCTSFERPDGNEPVKVDDLIERLPRSGKQLWVRLRGSPGSGKTTFLSGLYGAMNSQVIEPRNRRVPIFIDAESFRVAEDPVKSIQRDIASIADRVTDGNFVLLVDGLRAREGRLSSQLTKEIIERMPMNSIDAIFWSMSDDFEGRFEELTQERPTTPAIETWDIVSSTMSVRNPDFAEYLTAYIRLHSRLMSESATQLVTAEDLRRRVEEFVDGEDIDQHMLSLLLRSLKWTKYSGINSNIGILLKRYCADRILEDSFERPQSDEAMRRALVEPSWLAYRTVIADFHGDHLPRTFEISSAERRSRAWDLISEHNNIEDFLAAYFILDKIRQVSPGQQGQEAAKYILDNDLLGYDFPTDINRFVKALIDDLSRVERNRLLESINLLLKSSRNQAPHTETFLYYLLGRGVTGAKLSPTDILDKARRAVNSRVGSADEATRLIAKTQARTIAVSQIRLNEKAQGSAFLVGLVQDYELGSIDRGYHRLYYGDRLPSKQEMPRRYLDVPNTDWSKTYSRLRARLLEAYPELDEHRAGNDTVESIPDLSEPIPQELQHKVLTLLLFVQSRLRLSNSRESERRKFSIAVIRRTQHLEGWPPEIQHYLEMMLTDMNIPDTGRWRFILDVYRLKSEPRRGWLGRSLHRNFDIGRIESVAEHSHAAILLATLLLPETLPDRPNFVKQETINILAVHDIAEAYTGDMISRRLPPDRAELARDRERQAHDYLLWKKTYRGIHGTEEIVEMCRRITGPQRREDDDSAIVAKEIDKLENLIQLFIYKDIYGDWIPPDKFREFSDSLTLPIETELLKDLAKEFITWATTRDGPLLHTPALFDASLVEGQDNVKLAQR